MTQIELSKIEADYKSRMFTNVKLGSKFGVSETYIRKLAKKYNWIKQPLPQLEKIERSVTGIYDPGNKKNDKLANMTIDIAERMCDELHHMTANIGDIERWIMEATAMDDTDARRRVLLKVLSFTGRANNLKTLSNILVQTRGIIMSANLVGEGKKEQKQARADNASKGKFAPSEPPKISAVK